MTEPLLRALNRMRALILDPDILVKAVASGRQKGEERRRGVGWSCATSTSRQAAISR